MTERCLFLEEIYIIFSSFNIIYLFILILLNSKSVKSTQHVVMM